MTKKPRKARDKSPREKKPKVFNHRAWMIGALRKASRRYPPHYEAENEAKEEYFIPSKQGNPMRRVRIVCAGCGNKYSTGDMARDHIIPVINTATGFPLTPEGQDDWNTYISRMFVSKDKIQMLCTTCHDTKTGTENKSRAKARRLKKKLTKVE